MRAFFESVGGRKLAVIAGTILLAVLNESLGLGVSKETIQSCLTAAICGSGAIALEDALKALFTKKEDTPSA